MKVVLTHLWPESNAGDYAIVRGTIDAIEDASNEPVSFIGLTTFAHHSSALASHFPETLEKGVVLKPALIPSYKNDKCEQFGAAAKVALSVRYLLIALLLALGARTVPRYLVPTEQRQLLTDIAEADLVVIKGGAFLMGFPGVAGTLYLLRNALTAMWCARLNKRCVIAPHSFGPFANRLQHALLRVMLKGIRIYAREKISLQLLQEIGLEATYLADMAFYFGQQPELPRSGGQIAVTVRPCPTFLPLDRQQSYYDVLASTVSALVKDGFGVVFVPQVTGPDCREDDRYAIREIYDRVLSRGVDPEVVTVVDAITLQDRFRAYGRAVCVIGTRMHSVIFSCLTRTRVVALAYLGPKHQGIMDELGLGQYVLDISDVRTERLLSLVYEALATQDTARTGARVEVMRQQIRQEFSRLMRQCNLD